MKYYLLFSTLIIFGCQVNSASQKQEAPALQQSSNQEKYPVQKSEEEWKQMLSTEQFRVLRQQGTERAFTGVYDKFYEKGIYLCTACDYLLFDSETKFNSGTGWPSFYQPFGDTSVREIADYAYGMKRVEVVCANCGGHLGHVFDDGPKPTGLRYCINSVSLKFEDATPAKQKKTKSDQ